MEDSMLIASKFIEEIKSEFEEDGKKKNAKISKLKCIQYTIKNAVIYVP